MKWTSQDSQKGHEVSLICNVPWTALGGCTTSYSVGTRGLSLWMKNQPRLEDYNSLHHLAPRLRMSRAVLPFHHMPCSIYKDSCTLFIFIRKLSLTVTKHWEEILKKKMCTARTKGMLHTQWTWGIFITE
jgi:hypothetical protein